MSRLPWDEYFLDIAKVIAKRGTCPKKQVGALLVQGRHIIATGYNGSPSGMPHCNDLPTRGGGCTLDDKGKCKRAIHAEVNAIGQAARHGVATEGATLYINWAPCPDCQRALAAAGIARVVYAKRGSQSLFALWAGIAFDRVAGDVLDD